MGIPIGVCSCEFCSALGYISTEPVAHAVVSDEDVDLLADMQSELERMTREEQDLDEVPVVYPPGVEDRGTPPGTPPEVRGQPRRIPAHYIAAAEKLLRTVWGRK